jgi:hypothetical protein
VNTSVKEQVLEERLAKLATARSWSPRLVSKLESHIRFADDEALFRINPFTFARDRSLREDEVIDLFLHATSLGLFGMDWLLLCPKCSCVVESLRSLATVHNHYLSLPKTLSTRCGLADRVRSAGWSRSSACCSMYWPRLLGRKLGWRPRLSSSAIS